MLRAFINIFKIPDLRNKLLFTIGILVVYRIGFWIPLPGVDQQAMAEAMQAAMGDEKSAVANLMSYIQIFSGGNLSQSTLFGLGIMPYISAAIIFQLLTTVVPSLENLQKEGPAGRQKIQEYIRYATVGLCVIQAAFWMRWLVSQDFVYAEYTVGINAWLFWISGLVGLTAGTIFLMWLGEQIDKYGIGNGASLIITAGILSRMPSAIGWVADNFTLTVGGGGDGDAIGPMKVLVLIAAFVFVVAGTVLITQGQRRIPVQQAKHTRGRRVYGGQRSYLPLRVNHGGVMPIIFASSLLIIPITLVGWLGNHPTLGDYSVVSFLFNNFNMGTFLYELLYIAMIYFFAYFWTTVQFQPREMATNLRDHGSFIPGLRPGPRTAEYLERVMERITYVGAGFLAVIAVIPTIVAKELNIPFQVAAFLGGTGLLITVSVALDFVQRIEANLLMRNYGGFLDSGGRSGSGGGGGATQRRGPRIRGPRG
jgi:preprotein translocase subunit SecY